MLYAGTTIDCALMETIFHDVSFKADFKPFSKLKMDGKVHSVLRPTADLRLIDLITDALHKLGVKRNQFIDTTNAHYPATRRWAQALYTQFPDAQGLRWASRQDDQAHAVMLFGARVSPSELGKALKVGGKASYLITLGTAICGGSAIAAIAPITDASEEEISVSMGTVFLLNSVALLLFPAIGWWLHLSQNQFGLWAALAIHDPSSVVGAAAKYGPQALAIGTTVKLARALLIVPVSLITATYMSRAAKRDELTEHRAKFKVPWLIFLFVGASVLSTYLPRFMGTYLNLNRLGKAGLTATLFLIGTSLSKKTLEAVGIKPFLQGVILWIIVGTASLIAIDIGLIAI